MAKDGNKSGKQDEEERQLKPSVKILERETLDGIECANKRYVL